MIWTSPLKSELIIPGWTAIPLQVKLDQLIKRPKVCGGGGPKSPVGIVEGTAWG